ncbi:MAG: hypothetical protein L6R41_002190 [Letrouitia leprolyta]|nr:MAG: hypothetical protein L6R41_002190 [Letrouitia leprolyta]
MEAASLNGAQDAFQDASSSGTRGIRRSHRKRIATPPAFDKTGQHHHFDSNQPHIHRQASKARLLGIFNRTKSTKPSTITADQGPEGDVLTDQERKRSSTNFEPPPPQEIADLVPVEPISTAGVDKKQALKTKRTKSFKKHQPTNKSVPWDPPPLFQAYPQSVKHADVLAPTVSADTILRCNEKKRKQKKKDKTSTLGQVDGAGSDLITQNEDQDGLQDLDLARKIYVLVTSGYFLQYAGEGSFDRLPEKSMPIGQDSAAFASDAIPGKHWVLQVSHASDENGEPKLERRSLAKRLGIRSDGERCSASNYLLILDSPKDLDTWLSVVRKEIEAWGGKRYHSEIVIRPGSDEAAQHLRQRPSRQFLVKRDPNQFSGVPKASGDGGQGTVSGNTPTAGTRKHSTATQDSVQSPSTSNMTTSTDQNILDRLKSSPRMSRVSMEAKNYATSGESSPVPSPTTLSFHLEDFGSSQEQSKTMATSTHVPGPSSRSLSATRYPFISASSSGTPNFSVPNFSKRYSGAYSTPPLSTNSSGTSNPTRKSASPSIVKEQYDGSKAENTVAVDDVQIQVPRSSEASSFDEMSHRNPKSAEVPSADRPVPRRFSSLEYSRGISPIKSQSPRTPSPHPPPTSALPALPNSSNKNLSAPPMTLRRPVSMQIHTSPLPSSPAVLNGSLSTIPSPPAEGLDSSLSPPSRAPPPPPPPPATFFSSVRNAEQLLVPPSKVLNRRSMPHLGLPPSAPPTGPLPTPPVPRLPPIKLSSGSLRRSMERPLRAKLGTGTSGMLEASTTSSG